MSEQIDFSLSKLSLHSSGSSSSQNEDWDRSLVLSDPEHPSPFDSQSEMQQLAYTTPRNSVIFPADDGATPGRSTASSSSTTIPAIGREETSQASEKGNSKRSLSELLKLHAQKGTDWRFSVEEASRVADVLGQWINASSSPYEGEDDFFARSHDDLSLPSKRSPVPHEGRPRGRSESASSRPPSSAGSANP